MQTVGQMTGSLSWNIYFSFAEERIGYSRYIRYWAIVYLVSTLLVLLLVKEKKVSQLPNLARSYLNLLRLLTLKVKHLKSTLIDASFADFVKNSFSPEIISQHFAILFFIEIST